MYGHSDDPPQRTTVDWGAPHPIFGGVFAIGSFVSDFIGLPKKD
jgi:hypothetical protein